jgi:hypothetical protein
MNTAMMAKKIIRVRIRAGGWRDFSFKPVRSVQDKLQGRINKRNDQRMPVSREVMLQPG